MKLSLHLYVLITFCPRKTTKCVIMKYVYMDLKDEGRSRVVSTLTQLSDKCGLSARALSSLLDGGRYFDPRGEFIIQEMDVEVAKNKRRKGFGK